VGLPCVVDRSARRILCLGSDQAAQKSGSFYFDLGVDTAADAAVQSEIGHASSLAHPGDRRPVQQKKRPGPG
jgi:hypothetical protein